VALTYLFERSEGIGADPPNIDDRNLVQVSTIVAIEDILRESLFFEKIP
jgi:hypothetical protein